MEGIYDEPSPMWKAQLEVQTSNAELLGEIKDAVKEYYKETQGRVTDDPSEVHSNGSDEGQLVPVADADTAALPAKRESKPVVLWTAMCRSFLVYLFVIA